MKIKITKEKIILASIKVTILFTYLLLTGCKTSKTNCDAYGSTYEIKKDSLTIKVEHCHIEKENYCYYSVDTFRLTK